jgi:hypothetical protein
MPRRSRVVVHLWTGRSSTSVHIEALVIWPDIPSVRPFPDPHSVSPSGGKLGTSYAEGDDRRKVCGSRNEDAKTGGPGKHPQGWESSVSSSGTVFGPAPPESRDGKIRRSIGLSPLSPYDGPGCLDSFRGRIS